MGIEAFSSGSVNTSGNFYCSRFIAFIGNPSDIPAVCRKEDAGPSIAAQRSPMIQTALRTIQTLISTSLALTSLGSSIEVRDVNAQAFYPFRVEKTAQVLFFLSTECPISRFYAQEIQRICRDYGSQGVGCGLIYEDLPLEASAVRAHLTEFGYRGIPAAID